LLSFEFTSGRIEAEALAGAGRLCHSCGSGNRNTSLPLRPFKAFPDNVLEVGERLHERFVGLDALQPGNRVLSLLAFNLGNLAPTLERLVRLEERLPLRLREKCLEVLRGPAIG